jgi:hypothetical protein
LRKPVVRHLQAMRQKPWLTPSAMPNSSKRSKSGRLVDIATNLKENDRYGSRRRRLGESQAAAALDRPPDGGVDYRKRRLSARRAGQSQHSSWWSRLLAHRPSIAVRPQPHEIVPGSLPTADVALVSRWIDLNRDVIIDYWNGLIDFDEVKPRLQQVQL